MALVFFFNDTATTEIYTLSLHDALPISEGQAGDAGHRHGARGGGQAVLLGSAVKLAEGQTRAGEGDAATGIDVQGLHAGQVQHEDRKSTRLNSSHANISYAVFCLKKKKQ